MKKLLFFVLVLCLMGTLSAYAVDINGDSELGVGGMGPKRYVIVNEGAQTGSAPIVTLIPLALLPAGKCQVTSVTVQIHDATYNANRTVAIHDAGAVGYADNQNLEGENEAAAGETASIPFVRPLGIINGAVISQGINTVVTIEYERIRY